MFLGIALVLAACFVWGLIFVIPQFLIGFSSIEVALGRYFFFGSISLLFMISQPYRKWLRIPKEIWLKAWMFGLATNLLYYFSLVMGMRYANPSVIALITGISPISIAFYGNWKQKECSYKDLILPSILLGTGLIFVNLPAFQELPVADWGSYFFGLFCGILALILWNWYVVSNARLLKENPDLHSGDWATLIGVSTLFWALLVGGTLALGVADSADLVKYVTWNELLQRYLIGSFILGAISAWFGAFLWNLANKRLPISFTGQLTIFETVFGLVFVYLADQKLPNFYEWIGIVIILSGVGLALITFRQAIHQDQLIEAVS